MIFQPSPEREEQAKAYGREVQIEGTASAKALRYECHEREKNSKEASALEPDQPAGDCGG